MNQNSFCIKNCEYLEFVENGGTSKHFSCEFYKKKLETEISLSKSSIRPLKCDECNEENKIPTEKAKEIIGNSLETIEGHLEYIRELLEVL